MPCSTTPWNAFARVWRPPDDGGIAPGQAVRPPIVPVATSTQRAACILAAMKTDSTTHGSSLPLEALAHHFKHFAAHEAQDASPLYARLSRAIARDPELLALAGAATARPVPNLLFASVQYVLRRAAPHPLRGFYVTLGGAASPAADPVPHFRAFCLEHADAIRELLATRRVQTNEVGRCALLLPAFALVARAALQRPLALIEVGASAGFNLLWDQYAYDYGTGRIYGNRGAPVRLTCALHGEHRPSLPTLLPSVASRLGIDLQPVDVRDPDAVDWLRALVWPEHIDRLTLLEQAVAAACAAPPPLRASDAIDGLPEVLSDVPTDVLPCVYHTFTINQLSRPARTRLAELLDAFGATRDVATISIAYGAEPLPELRMVTYRQGIKHERLLAYCHPHGQWLDWRDELSAWGDET